MAIESLFVQPLQVVTIGLVHFYEIVSQLGVECRQVQIMTDVEGKVHQNE